MTTFGLDPKVLEQLRSVLRLYPAVETASIFGSRGRGDHNDRSDIDVAVYAPTMDVLGYMNLRAALRNLPIIYKIDLVHVETCDSSTLKKEIVRDGKIFYPESDD